MLSTPCKKRRASSRDDGVISWFFFELRQDVWGFSRVTTGNSGSLSCGPREVQSPFELRGGVRHCSPVTQENWPQGALKSESRGLSRGATGNPGLLRLVTVTSGNFSGCVLSQEHCGVGMGLSELHWVWCNGRGPHLELRWEPQGSSPVETWVSGCA